MNLLTARELHKRYGHSNLIASSFHPGAVRTPIWSKGGVLARLLGLLMYPFMWPVEKGADTFVWLASSDDEAVLGAAGGYFFALDASSGEELWNISLGRRVHAAPMTFAVDGEQFVTIASGNVVYTFGLRD